MTEEQVWKCTKCDFVYKSPIPIKGIFHQCKKRRHPGQTYLASDKTKT